MKRIYFTVVSFSATSRRTDSSNSIIGKLSQVTIKKNFMSLLLFRPLELIEFGLLLTEAVSREGKKATLGLSKKMIFSMVQLIGK